MATLIGGVPEFTQEHMLAYLTATCPPNVDLPFIVRIYYMVGWGTGLRADVLLLQAQKETAGFSSFLFKTAHNLAGIGALPNQVVKNVDGHVPPPIQGTSWNYDPVHDEWVPACQYKNLVWGIFGHFYHMLIYTNYVRAVTDAGVGEEFDPRFNYTLSVRQKMPLALTLLDLTGTWATSQTYGPELEKRVIEVRNFRHATY